MIFEVMAIITNAKNLLSLLATRTNDICITVAVNADKNSDVIYFHPAGSNRPTPLISKIPVPNRII
jgi:hypothetical protein